MKNSSITPDNKNPEEEYSRLDPSDFLMKAGFSVEKKSGSSYIRKYNWNEYKAISTFNKQDWNSPEIYDWDTSENLTLSNKQESALPERSFHSITAVAHNQSGTMWLEGTLGSMSTLISINTNTWKISYSDTKAHSFRFLWFSHSWELLLTAKTWTTQFLLNPNNWLPYEISSERKRFHEIEYKWKNRFKWTI